MAELTEEMRRLKKERNNLDEELKRAERSYESIRTSSFTAMVGHVRAKGPEPRRPATRRGQVL